MLIQFEEFLTFENIYLWANFGVLPFWLMVILIPNSKVTKVLVNSVLLPLILASAYIYVIYKTILLDESIFEIFMLYVNLDNLDLKKAMFWCAPGLSRDGLRQRRDRQPGSSVGNTLLVFQKII